MKSYAVTIWMKANIWSKLKIPFNRSFQLFFQVLIEIIRPKSLTPEKSSPSLVNLPSLKFVYFLPFHWGISLSPRFLSKVQKRAGEYLPLLKDEQRYSSSTSQIFTDICMLEVGGGGRTASWWPHHTNICNILKHLFLQDTLKPGNLTILASLFSSVDGF